MKICFVVSAWVEWEVDTVSPHAVLLVGTLKFRILEFRVKLEDSCFLLNHTRGEGALNSPFHRQHQVFEWSYSWKIFYNSECLHVCLVIKMLVKHRRHLGAGLGQVAEGGSWLFPVFEVAMEGVDREQAAMAIGFWMVI